MTSTYFSLADELGTDLSSRQGAARLRESVLRAVLPAGSKFQIDFFGVRTLSDSFADELFGILVAECGEDWFREHVQLLNLSPQLRTTILEAVAERLSLTGSK